jgi:hypothetical protein
MISFVSTRRSASAPPAFICLADLVVEFLVALDVEVAPELSCV